VTVMHLGGFMSADGELEERGMVDLRPMSAPPPKLSFTTTRQTDTFQANGKSDTCCNAAFCAINSLR